MSVRAQVTAVRGIMMKHNIGRREVARICGTDRMKISHYFTPDAGFIAECHEKLVKHFKGAK